MSDKERSELGEDKTAEYLATVYANAFDWEYEQHATWKDLKEAYQTGYETALQAASDKHEFRYEDLFGFARGAELFLRRFRLPQDHEYYEKYSELHGAACDMLAKYGPKDEESIQP